MKIRTDWERAYRFDRFRRVIDERLLSHNLREFVNIDSVTFAKTGLDWRDAPIGDSRIELLRKFYRGEDLGDWVAVAYNPKRELSKDDVNWETADERVTRDG